MVHEVSEKKVDKFTDEQFAELRKQMVEQQLESRGIKNPAVLSTMRRVPRHKFVPIHLRRLAYEDRPLRIGYGQTISQPFIVAFMCESLNLGTSDRVLEVGTGSGYGAAVLAGIVSEVVTIERIPELSYAAQKALDDAGVDNVRLVIGDGTKGFEECAPYTGIIITAAGPKIPDGLMHQLTIGGKLVMPVYGHGPFQNLMRITRLDEVEFVEEFLCEVRFVPLIGDEGGADSTPAD